MFRCLLPLLIAVCSFALYPDILSAKPRQRPTAQTMNTICAAMGNVAVATVHAREAGALPSMLMHNAIASIPARTSVMNKEAMIQFHQLIIVYIYKNPEVSAQTAQQFVETACFQAFTQTFAEVR